MVLPPGVALAAWMAERNVTTPAGGFRMSAKLLTLKTAGTRRSSSTSIFKRQRTFARAEDFFPERSGPVSQFSTCRIKWWTRVRMVGSSSRGLWGGGGEKVYGELGSG